MWQKATVVCFKVLSENLPAGRNTYNSASLIQTKSAKRYISISSDRIVAVYIYRNEYFFSVNQIKP
jgi:hypothetical protein